MTGPFTKATFKKMINGNLDWLLKQPQSLERDHIEDILNDAADHYYPSDADMRSAIEAALRIESLWLPPIVVNDEAHAHELRALAAMKMRFEAALNGSVAERGWQKMDSAPKDGTLILLKEHHRVFVGKWAADPDGSPNSDWFLVLNASSLYPTSQVIGWMYLNST